MTRSVDFRDRLIAEDCAKLKLRARRNHDARRTMPVSLVARSSFVAVEIAGRNGGRELLIVDRSSECPIALAEEDAHIRRCEVEHTVAVEVGEGKLLELPKTAAVGGGAASEPALAALT